MLLVAVAGCQMPRSTDTERGVRQGEQGKLSPVLERMHRVYADLATGRFLSIADFESPRQDQLFRCVGEDGDEGSRAQPALSILRSRDATGAGSVKASLAEPGDRLVLDGRRSDQFALPRDWSRYHLLLMSIYGPRGGVLLEFTIRSGVGERLSWTRTIEIGPGWNLCRIDLATAGAVVDLTDVRSLEWRAPGNATPLDLYLDDIIVTDNTSHVLGPATSDGDMYVLERGRRIHVGCRGRFEVAFCDGVLVAWNGEDDENLVDAGGLGPWPVPLDEGWSRLDETPPAYDDPALFADWGTIVAARQEVVEATPFRVVVEGRWLFAGTAASDAAEASSPGHVWRYTVYASGAVHVSVNSVAPPAGWRRPRVGYAMGLDGRRGFEMVVPPVAAVGRPESRFVLMARPGSDRSDLLWAWSATSQLDWRRQLESADGRRLALIVGDVAAGEEVETAHLLRVWPRDIDAAPEAASLADDYRHPVELAVAAGRLITGAAGDLDQDGYNESEGCYELALARGVARFEFRPGSLLRFDPVFRVRGTAGRRCWVYARGRVVTSVGRDAGGELLFRLPGVISRPVALEVHTIAEEAGKQ